MSKAMLRYSAGTADGSVVSSSEQSLGSDAGKVCGMVDRTSGSTMQARLRYIAGTGSSSTALARLRYVAGSAIVPLARGTAAPSSWVGRWEGLALSDRCTRTPSSWVGR